MKNIIFVLLGIISLIGCKQIPKETQNTSQNLDTVYSEEELYRPNFHFTPKKAWMNDPNGMFYLNGTYHLFFQHTPFQSVPDFGKMHWGHAISKDLIRWEELTPALAYDDKGAIFSGSAVVDKDNISGFGDGKNVPVVAIFTYHDMKKEKAGEIDAQSQAIAYSLDSGKTWTKYSNNPVLKNPGIKDFRDPKVFWDTKRKQWVMGVAAQNRQHFYASKNLKDWTFLSEFGKDVGGHGGVWECPDLFPIKVKGTNEEKWVLIVNINPGGPNGGSAAQYFVGDFDGKTFKMDDIFTKQLEKEKVVWLDSGRDNYASVTFNNIPDNKRIIIGWMSNWEYANVVPTETWRSSMTIARQLELQKVNSSYRLLFQPVKELANYRSVNFKKESTVINEETKIIDSKAIDLSSTEINFKVSELKNSSFIFKLTNKQGDTLAFGYNYNDNNFFIDRRKSGKIEFSEKFADRVSIAKRTSLNPDFIGKIILDKTSIELFFDNGETVMTEIFFPNSPFDKLSIKPKGQELNLDYIEIHELNFN